MKKLALLLFLGWSFAAWAQHYPSKSFYKSSKFEQLGEMLPTPNTYRTGEGSPGPDYWQQRADYKIKVELNDANQSLKGSETITYYNNSPSDLSYIWLQLDQNHFHKDSDAFKADPVKLGENPDFGFMGWVFGINSTGGYQIGNVRDEKGQALRYTINQTMMRIDLPQPLKAKGGKFTFSIDWSFNIVDCKKFQARSGYEYFPKDGNYLYEMAQFFPRMAVYDDVNGWQHKQFLGAGEFALAFGDYEVAITVPADHIVGATGELQNAKEVLTADQLKRWEQAKGANDPVLIVNQAEAVKAEQNKGNVKNNKTWIYKAQNVRDFAWVSSRKFIWDAMQINLSGKKVWAMSYYPKEGNPLWGHYSTRVVAHTLRVYSKYTIDYPYPVAISVHGPQGGMEYPMICFNGGRPQEDGTYSEQTRNGMVSVIIHEVGHNFFPMIINSDERQWTWMDEGLNSFCQYLAECEIPQQEWAKKDYPSTYPSRRGPAKNIVKYMTSDPSVLEPIMTNSEGIIQFGNNAYGKPATALNILRETVMGKELFDYAFKEYSRKWAFKHPMPADFFRTMENASAVDLDWFWRGWFFTTEPCDIAIEEATAYRFSNETLSASAEAAIPSKTIKADNIAGAKKQLERFGMFMSEADEKSFSPNKYFYDLKFKNVGGLLMPIIVQMNYKDGSNEIVKIPAEIWRKDPEEVHKVFMTDKEVVSFVLDPKFETADINTNNNSFPRKATENKFEEMKKKEQSNK
ncbi:MAG: M1 family metallopeptidase [Microscillaceae bacterium]|jgi:hypothetical protein|nr:M1 family metallopeptidase [Microscillaceae bacterium]